MWIARSMHPGWLSNSWLVADQPGGHAVLVDSGGPLEPIVAAIEEQRLTLTHVLCTHHHIDHVAHNADYQGRYGCCVCGHTAERALFSGLERDLDTELTDGDELCSGELRIRALHVPGHTLGQLAFLIGDGRERERVFTGDTLFRRSVGGTRGPGHTTYDDLRHSVLEVLLQLPKETIVHPGHMETTTVAEEWEQNPFVRLWRGLDSPREVDCTVGDEPARLVLEARDYDGGTKALVRFPDGSLDLAPGSRVQRR